MLNDRELKTVCFSVGFFALGATALILYQHAKHTGAIQATLAQQNAAALAKGPQNASLASASLYSMPTGPASLAGMPTLGQQAYQSDPIANNLSIGKGYTLN